MKSFTAKNILISSFLALNAAAANANIYTYTFTVDDFSGQDPVAGTLEGTITIDMNQADSSINQSTDSTASAIPAWLTSASFTFTNTNGNPAFPTITKTLLPGTSTDGVALNELFWQTNSGTFNPGGTFHTQFTNFAFRSADNRFSGPGFLGLGQQVFNTEFLLVGSETTAVPGPLPFLGLATFAYYFRKFKKTNS